ncbi:Cd(II)/Pb(II)-responsive transcriptional regulator, partial [Pseudomonas aeruginosa]|nr:Cd(II)/Pb(II)-responsive transcriptional regulator [Pseudomonas aeruginosa]
IDEHLHHVEVRIAELQALREQLQDLGSRCTVAGNSQACGILRELEQPAPLSPIPEECAEAGHMHVPGVHRRHG